MDEKTAKMIKDAIAAAYKEKIKLMSKYALRALYGESAREDIKTALIQIRMAQGLSEAIDVVDLLAIDAREETDNAIHK